MKTATAGSSGGPAAVRPLRVWPTAPCHGRPDNGDFHCL